MTRHVNDPELFPELNLHRLSALAAEWAADFPGTISRIVLYLDREQRTEDDGRGPAFKYNLLIEADIKKNPAEGKKFLKSWGGEIPLLSLAFSASIKSCYRDEGRFNIDHWFSAIIEKGATPEGVHPSVRWVLFDRADRPEIKKRGLSREKKEEIRWAYREAERIYNASCKNPFSEKRAKMKALEEVRGGKYAMVKEGHLSDDALYRLRTPTKRKRDFIYRVIKKALPWPITRTQIEMAIEKKPQLDQLVDSGRFF